MAKSKRPTPPSHLTTEAKAEWKRVCNDLARLGTLDAADRALISLYCASWARWCKAETKIAEKNELVEAPKTRVPMFNLWLSIAKNAHAEVVRLAFELGLSPNARAKIRASQRAKPEEDDDLDLEE